MVFFLMLMVANEHTAYLIVGAATSIMRGTTPVRLRPPALIAGPSPGELLWVPLHEEGGPEQKRRHRSYY